MNVSPPTVLRGTTQQCSPKLFLLDFYVRGKLNPSLYSSLIANEQTHHKGNFYARQTILYHPGTFGRGRQSVIRRVHTCAISDGGRLSIFCESSLHKRQGFNT